MASHQVVLWSTPWSLEFLASSLQSLQSSLWTFYGNACPLPWDKPHCRGPCCLQCWGWTSNIQWPSAPERRIADMISLAGGDLWVLFCDLLCIGRWCFSLVFQMFAGWDFLHVHTPLSLWALYPRCARLLAYWHEKMWVLDPCFVSSYCRLDMFCWGRRWNTVPSCGRSRAGLLLHVAPVPLVASIGGGLVSGLCCLMPAQSLKAPKTLCSFVCDLRLCWLLHLRPGLPISSNDSLWQSSDGGT